MCASREDSRARMSSKALSRLFRGWVVDEGDEMAINLRSVASSFPLSEATCSMMYNPSSHYYPHGYSLHATLILPQHVRREWGYITLSRIVSTPILPQLSEQYAYQWHNTSKFGPCCFEQGCTEIQKEGNISEIHRVRCTQRGFAACRRSVGKN